MTSYETGFNFCDVTTYKNISRSDNNDTGLLTRQASNIFITAALRVVDVKVYESKEGLEVIVIKKINMQHCLMQAS